MLVQINYWLVTLKMKGEKYLLFSFVFKKSNGCHLEQTAKNNRTVTHVLYLLMSNWLHFLHLSWISPLLPKLNLSLVTERDLIIFLSDVVRNVIKISVSLVRLHISSLDLSFAKCFPSYEYKNVKFYIELIFTNPF